MIESQSGIKLPEVRRWLKKSERPIKHLLLNTYCVFCTELHVQAACLQHPTLAL